MSDIKVDNPPKISKSKIQKLESSSRKNESKKKIDKKKTNTLASCFPLEVFKPSKNKQPEKTGLFPKQEITIVVPKHGTKMPEIPEMPHIKNLNIRTNLPEQEQKKVNIFLLYF